MKTNQRVIGVLALQGGFLEHLVALRTIGVVAREVRLPNDLNDIDGLIIPGGESTTISQMMDLYELRKPISDFAKKGSPIWGTCAGIIMLSMNNSNENPETLSLIDINIKRNAYGRQSESFIADLDSSIFSDQKFQGVFIRAPIIARVGKDIEVLSWLKDESPVAVRQGSILGTTFHPELTDDYRYHKYFLTFFE
ncbi:MAG: pyridoxal 5'-phosphate synthase glutaminase subunit PdxT [Chloroflexi bacterium]|nr:pyridoxal 5'-phosphate synthase glutaminase subunit PdxT [Chloroflexota bacterium]